MFQVHIFLLIMIVLFSTTLIECPAEFMAAEVQVAAGDAPTAFGSCVVVVFSWFDMHNRERAPAGIKRGCYS